LTSRRRRPAQSEPDDSERDLGAPADPEAVARTILLTKLTGQARSRHELEQALDSRGVPADVATSVLDRFEAVGLVDDAAFADAWVQFRQSTRGLSRQALRHELRRKGVDDNVIDTSVESVDPATEVETARRLVERKLRTMSRLPTETRFRRLSGLLARKGYPSGLTYRVVREALAADTSPMAVADGDESVLLDPC
jgi:regulatory protein